MKIKQISKLKIKWMRKYILHKLNFSINLLGLIIIHFHMEIKRNS